MTSLFFLGPRAAIILWYLLQPLRWQATFSTFVWPFLGFLFLPWTTLAYVVVAPGGIVGAEWILLALAFVVDLAGYAGGYGNRDRVRGYVR